MGNQSELIFYETTNGNLQLKLTGEWNLHNELPLIENIEKSINIDSAVKTISFDTKNIEKWDTSLLTFLIKVNRLCDKLNVKTDKEGLPDGVNRLLTLATAVPERKNISRDTDQSHILHNFGLWVINSFKSSIFTVHFLGEVSLSFLRMVSGKASFRTSELFTIIQECGANALPIVTLISLLIGLILAFMGAIQLEMFGAEIYVANLVGLGMAREMGCMMTAIIMAGRTGAAFAAQIGSMHVNDEIDALHTFGISPIDALVLPRMIALALMMPLLCIYSDFLGIIGGAIVGVTALNLSFLQYFEQTKNTVGLVDFGTGLFKSSVFGIIIASAGCLKGIRCGKSSTDVGKATTSAVVTSFVFIVIADAVLTIIYSIIDV